MIGSSVGRRTLSRFLTQTATHLRANESGYVEVASLRCRPYSPGTTRAMFRSLTSRYRESPLGTIALEAGTAVIAKDRLSLDGRTFDVIAPMTPNPDEYLRRVLVREVQQPERECYLAFKPDGYDGASNEEPLPELVRVLPIPFITDRPTDTVVEREGRGLEVARLKEYQLAEIAINFFSQSNIARLLYCLIVSSDITPTAQQARDRSYPRYRFNGAPSYESYQWSAMFPWCVGLVEDK